MNPTTVHPAQTPKPIPWWKVPDMWLVVGGPLVVVVAAIATAILAVKGADPLLNKADFERDLKAAQASDGRAKARALDTLQPAQLARNHAASPMPALPGR